MSAPTERRPGARFAELDEVELTIEKLVDGGDGLGRVAGAPVFVPRSAPGDRVRVRLVERRPGYARGEIVDLLEAGPGRIEPRCPHFARCGGCDLQHLDRQTELRAKSEATLETLRRLSKLELPAPRSIAAGAEWGWRARTGVRLRRRDGGLEVGYFERGSREFVPVRTCPVLAPALEAAVLALADPKVPADSQEPPERIDLAVGEDGSISAAPPWGELEGGEIRQRVAGFELGWDARCFFQGHRGLLDRLVGLAVGEEGGETAYDLFGGVGLFALPLARRYDRVVLVESDRIAVRYASRNVRRARLENVEIVGRSVEGWLGEGLPQGADRVVVDPPRDGLSRVARRLLLGRAPKRLTYVSCHPAALARDLAELAERYRVATLDLVDLFPRTGHMEVVAQLELREETA